LRVEAGEEPMERGRPIPVDALPDALGRAHFAVTDVLRRAQGDALGAIGLGPQEHPWRIVGSGPRWRLRDYGGGGTSAPLMIVAAPIKRPYIWDLAASVRAVRRCLHAGLHVHLLEWQPATQATAGHGIDHCVEAFRACTDLICAGERSRRIHLAGHSLGGTLAAIFCAAAPEKVAGLVLIGAPLSFQPATSRFRDALVALAPSAMAQNEPFPGSLLSQMSALASPETFVWARAVDALLSLSDPRALDIHARVERWALDETALPGRLVHEIVEWLYRDNRFHRGTLPVEGRLVGPPGIACPVLAVVTAGDEVAPAASIDPFIAAVAASDVCRIDYAGETGVGLLHLGALIGRDAHARVWPQIVQWLQAHGSAPPAGRSEGRPPDAAFGPTP